ncbi:sensor histidine kinase [Nakamurella leprariae]|uniref:Sensor-like histidine kinase SenX3 n=1 Tax=Nakamurella leprariae TaxID=2803911 RepID=A0A938YG73_9ACTN|nr:sensor histidine kinase [Nakamurella leprariae]MBM9467549.1 sensor histidine kinase [Nakamurella leprariae]
MVSGSRWSIARRILLVQGLLLVVVLAGMALALRAQVQDEARDVTGARMSSLTRTLAVDPTVVATLTDAVPDGREVTDRAAALQPFTTAVERQAGADFVVVMLPDGTRLTHPDPDEVGQQYLGSRDGALAGATTVETFDGTLGASVRAISPVLTVDGRVVGLVAAGVTVDHVLATTPGRVALIALIALAGLVVGVAGAVAIARWVRRQTLGLDPRELARLFSYYDAVLASAHNGMVLLDPGGRLVRVNPEALRLLGLPEDTPVAGRRTEEIGLPPEVAALMAGADVPAGPRADGEPDGPGVVRDRLVLVGDRVLLFNRRPAVRGGRHGAGAQVLGALVVLRDHTELQALTGELDRTQSFAAALRAQAHESANRLHTVVSLIELGEPEHALEFAVRELQVSQDLADRMVLGVGDRAVAALLLGKSAQAAEQGVQLTLRPGSQLPEGLVDERELITVLGNLIDNSLDVLAGAGPGPESAAGPVGERRIEVGASVRDGALELTVQDTGPGLTADQAAVAFRPGWSTKPGTGPAGTRGLGLALVAQAVGRLRGTVTVRPGPGARFVVRLPVAAPGWDAEAFGVAPGVSAR